MTLSDTALVDLNTAKSYLHINTAATLHVEAEYVGEGDEYEDIFGLDHAPIEGSLKVFVDSALQEGGYSLDGSGIQFDDPPSAGSHVTASYDRETESDTFEGFDDAVLEKMVEAATKIAEDFVERCFVSREVSEDHMGDGTTVLKLYKKPVASIESVVKDGEELEADYDYEDRSYIGRLILDSGWTTGDKITVAYTAGYGTREAALQAVPDAALAVLLILGDLYENRGDTVGSINIAGIGSTSYNIPSRAQALLRPMKVAI